MKKYVLLSLICILWIPSYAHAARLLDNGWELQSNLDGVDEGGLSWNGQGTIDTSVKRSGAAAMRINSVGSATKNFDQALAPSNITGPAYVGFALLVHAYPTSALEIASMSSAAGSPRAQLKLTSGGQLQLFDGQAATQIGGNSATLSLDTWYYVEFEWSTTTYAARLTPDSSGVPTTFASGTPTTPGTGVNVLRIGVSATDATLNIVYDDIKANDSTGSNQNSWPGNGKLIRLTPNAAGDVNTFGTQTGGTAGSSNNFTRVDETTPDDATSYNGSNTLNQEDLFNMSDSGIGTSDTVNVVEVGVRHRNNVADATTTLKPEVEKTSGGTKTQGVAITPNATTFHTNRPTSSSAVSVLITYADPDGAAWTKSTLDSMQAGYKITTGGTNRIDVTTLWGYVDYTPAASTTSKAISQNISFTYDADGDITQVIDNSNSDAAATTTYTYDGLNRLTAASSTGVMVGNNFFKTWTYDALGNISSSTDNGPYSYGGSSGSIWANPDAPTSIGTSTTLAYDHNGNLLTYKAGGNATSTYAWDYLNRLIQSASGGASTTYGYDINNERVFAGSTYYPFTFYNTQGSTSTITKHIFVNGEPIADIQGSGTTSASTYFIYGDQLNSTNVVGNSAANVDQLYAYYPYGATRVAEKNGSFTEQRQYVGDEFDSGSSLNYLNSRYFNSGQGQFISQDPIFTGPANQQNLADPQSLNAYSYSEDNPITKSDPSGKQFCEDACVGEAAVATYPEWSPYVIPALNAAFNIAGTYLSNYLAHQPTTPTEVVASGGAGILFPYIFGNSASGLFASGVAASALDDFSAKRKGNLGEDVVNGAVNTATYGIFRYDAGISPFEEAAQEDVLSPSSQTVLNELRYQTVLNTFQTSSGVVAQQAYANSSINGGVQQVQSYISSQIQSGSAKVGNMIGSFTGTYSFGGSLGTYNGATGKWTQ